MRDRNDNETLSDLSGEDRLKAIVYQFVALYERWSEDRQAFVQQNFDAAELVRIFTQQVKNFEELEPTVREHLTLSIRNATVNATREISEKIGKEATSATEKSAQRLMQVTDVAERTLRHYQSEIIASQWKIILISVVTAITCSLLVVWLLVKILMPAPILPLSNKQIEYLNSGMMMEKVWPKLSKKEQEQWRELLAPQTTSPNQK